jgi:hypothetical protein
VAKKLSKRVSAELYGTALAEHFIATYPKVRLSILLRLRIPALIQLR